MKSDDPSEGSAIPGRCPPAGSDGLGETASGGRGRDSVHDERPRGDAALGHRTPGCRWPSRAPGRGATSRLLADRVRDQARRSDGPHVVSPAAAGCRAVRPVGAGSCPARSARVAACRRHATCSSSPLDQWRGDCLSAARPPGGRDADARRAGRPGRPASPTTGPTRRPCGPPGPASTPAPTSTATAPSSTAPRSTPASPTWRSWPGPAGLRPRPLRVHRHLGRSAHGAARRPEALQLRGGPAGLPGPGRGPLGAGQPGVGSLARRAGRRRARRIPTSSTSRSTGFPGADEHGSTWAPARFPPSCPRRRSCARRWSSGWSATATSPSSSTPRSSGPTRPGGTRSATTTSTRPTRSGPSSGARRPRRRRPSTRSARLALGLPGCARPATSGSAGSCAPPTTAPSARWTTGWPPSSTT